MVFSVLHRKDALIYSTIELIDEIGVQALTTKKVAQKQGVSEGTIFKHFGSKQGLLLAVLEYFAQYDVDIIETVTINQMKPMDAIEYFVNTYAMYYESYPAITAITQIFDVLRYDAKLSNTITKIFLRKENFLIEMIKKAQEEGEIAIEVEAKDLAILIMAMIPGFCLKWRMEGYTFCLRKSIVDTLQMILKGVKG